VVLQLKRDTSRDLDLDSWSWRTALQISHEIAASRMRQVVLCIVTRQMNPIQDVWRETAVREIGEIFSDLTTEATRTRSLLKLLPLPTHARERYLVQVLRERYGYSGEVQGVPQSLLDFVSERTAGNPKYIEEMLQELHGQDMLQFELDDQGDEGGGMVVLPISDEDLRAVPNPPKMVGTVLQQFDTLEPQLQRVLKTVSPLMAFSEGMLVDVGLPSSLVRRLAHLFSVATDEGILEPCHQVPTDVLKADPNAKQAWRWLLLLMREEVLASVLHAERDRVEKKMAELVEYNRIRLSEMTKRFSKAAIDAEPSSERARAERDSVARRVKLLHMAGRYHGTHESGLDRHIYGDGFGGDEEEELQDHVNQLREALGRERHRCFELEEHNAALEERVALLEAKAAGKPAPKPPRTSAAGGGAASGSPAPSAAAASKSSAVCTVQ